MVELVPIEFLLVYWIVVLGIIYALSIEKKVNICLKHIIYAQGIFFLRNWYCEFVKRSRSEKDQSFVLWWGWVCLIAVSLFGWSKVGVGANYGVWKSGPHRKLGESFQTKACSDCGLSVSLDCPYCSFPTWPWHIVKRFWFLSLNCSGIRTNCLV